MCQTTFEKKLVAETSKELVFLLPQRKIRCATTSFFGVGGSGRRPLEVEVGDWRQGTGDREPESRDGEFGDWKTGEEELETVGLNEDWSLIENEMVRCRVRGSSSLRLL